MDKDRVEGSAKQIKGNIKEGLGKLTGDTKTEAEGKADKAEGKVQNTIGGIKDKALAAYRAGITELILPRENEKDLEDIPGEVRDVLQVHLVE